MEITGYFLVVMGLLVALICIGQAAASATKKSPFRAQLTAVDVPIAFDLGMVFSGLLCLSAALSAYLGS